MLKLFDFQKKGLADTEGFDRCAYYWEMGTGKTFVGSERLKSFRNDKNLVVCQKSKVKDWVDHFKQHYLVSVYDLTKKAEFESFFDEMLAPRIGVINYDLIHRRPELLEMTDFSLMLDESQYIQNETAKRTKAILKMNPKNVVLLSGTPVSGKYEQLWAQLRLLGWRISKKDFWDKYVVYRLWYPVEGMFSIKIVIGYKNVDDLKANLKRYGATFLKSEEAIDLPEQTFNTVHVPVSREYKKFMKDKIITIGDTTLVGDTPLKAALYARQLCGAYSKEKLKTFEDLVNSTESRLVVFYNFTAELDAMKSVIGDRPCSIINGSTRDMTNYEKCDDSITFIQYQSGAEGINAQLANKMIYFSPPLSVAKFEQSAKRIHRLGQTKKCFYYYLTCVGSIEEKIYQSLEEGSDFNERLFEK